MILTLLNFPKYVDKRKYKILPKSKFDYGVFDFLFKFKRWVACSKFSNSFVFMLF